MRLYGFAALFFLLLCQKTLQLQPDNLLLQLSSDVRTPKGAHRATSTSDGGGKDSDKETEEREKREKAGKVKGGENGEESEKRGEKEGKEKGEREERGETEEGDKNGKKKKEKGGKGEKEKEKGEDGEKEGKEKGKKGEGQNRGGKEGKRKKNEEESERDEKKHRILEEFSPLTWIGGLSHCQKKSELLCAKDELCNGSHPLLPLTNEHQFIPVSRHDGKEDDWISYGSKDDPVCSSWQDLHHEPPSWGSHADQMEAWKGKVLCCPHAGSKASSRGKKKVPSSTATNAFNHDHPYHGIVTQERTPLPTRPLLRPIIVSKYGKQDLPTGGKPGPIFSYDELQKELPVQPNYPKN